MFVDGEAFLEQNLTTSKLLKVKISLRLRLKPLVDIGPRCTRLSFDGRTFVYGRDSLAYLALVAEKLDETLNALGGDFREKAPDLSEKDDLRYYEAKQLSVERESAVDLKWVNCHVEATLKTEDRLPSLEEIRLLDDLFSLLMRELQDLEHRIVCQQFGREERPKTRGDT